MNIFNITNLFRAYFIENKKMLLLCSIITFASLACGFTDNSMPEFSPVLPWLILLWIAGTFFQPILKRNNSTHFFNLPVSTGEKLLSATCLIIIMGCILFLLSLAGAYTGRYLIRPLIYFKSMEFPNTIIECLNFNIDAITYFGAALFGFLFGSIYFKKNAFWKTLVSGLGVLFGIALYSLALISIAFSTKFENSDYPININLGDYQFVQNYHYIFPLVLLVFFLFLTYLRLKETEV